MQTQAAVTDPRSHAEVLESSRTPAGIARGTDLGRVSLVRFYEPCSPPHGSLVREHRAERGPASIQDGLRHLGASQTRAVHIAHDDQAIGPDDRGRLFMQEMAALGGNLPVYGARKRLAAGALRTGQPGG